MKTLRVYLAEKEIRLKEFSQTLEIHQSYLSSIMSGRHKPSKRLARDITKATQGEVVFDTTRKDMKEPSQQAQLSQ